MEEAEQEAGRVRRDQIMKGSVYRAKGLHLIFKAMRNHGLE